MSSARYPGTARPRPTPAGDDAYQLLNGTMVGGDHIKLGPFFEGEAALMVRVIDALHSLDHGEESVTATVQVVFPVKGGDDE